MKKPEMMSGFERFLTPEKKAPKSFEQEKLAGFEAILPKLAFETPVGVTKQPADLQNLSKISSGLFKVAMRLDRSTAEEIEMRLKELVLNDLSFFPDRLNVTVDIKPLKEEPLGKSTQGEMNITDATGSVDISYNGALVQLPFMLRDKEILPFDTIQLGTENTVFTRENMKNILFNLKNARAAGTRTSAQAAVPGTPSPYVSVDKATNTSTDVGFMSDMLSIQNTLGNQPAGYTPGQGRSTVYASVIDELLEKVASIEKVTEVDEQAEWQLAHELKGRYEKIAACEDYVDDKALEKTAMFDDLHKLNYVDVQIFEDKEKFTFMEHEGTMLSMNWAQIFNKLFGVGDLLSDLRMIITSDKRFKLLSQGERFGATLERNKELMAPEAFSFKYRTSESLNPGHIYTAEVGGFMFMPFTCIKAVSGDYQGLKVSRLYLCEDVKGKKFNMILVSNLGDNQVAFQSKERTMGIMAGLEDAKNLPYYDLHLRSTIPVVCIPENTPFLQLKTGDVNSISSAQESTILLDGNVKLASLTNCVEVYRLNGDSGAPQYGFKLNWFDEKLGRPTFKIIEGVNEVRLVGMLQRAGFDYGKASEIALEVKSKSACSYPLPLRGATPWMVKPDMTAKLVARKSVEDAKASFINKKMTDDALVALVGGTPTDSPLNIFAKSAAEAAAISREFEKVAIERESEDFRKLAGMMALKSRVDTLLKEASAGEFYDGRETLASLGTLVPEMEKMAYDLVQLKLEQAVNRHEMVDPRVITACLHQMDSLVKYAGAFRA